MAEVLQLLFNGLLVGSIFALGGVGLTLVYGILRLANFAHGDSLTVGAYVAWVVTATTSGYGVAGWEVAGVLVAILVGIVAWDLAASRRMRPVDRWLGLGTAGLVAIVAAWDAMVASPNVAILAGLVMAAVAVALLSLGIDQVLWRRLRRQKANILTLMIVSIGVAFMLRSSIQMIFGGDIRVFFAQTLADPVWINQAVDAVGLGLSIGTFEAWVLATALVAVVVTHLVLNKTRIGKAMRALSDNPDLARVAGIDTERVTAYVWLLGGALVGLAGMLLALKQAGLHTNLGWFALLSLFAAVILGGIGSATGAMLGGLIIGVAQELSTLWIPSGYKLAVGFAILILTLLIRPQGIMGVPRT